MDDAEFISFEIHLAKFMGDSIKQMDRHTNGPNIKEYGYDDYTSGFASIGQFS